MKKISAREPKVKILAGLAVLLAIGITYHFLKGDSKEKKRITTTQLPDKITNPGVEIIPEITEEEEDTRRTLYFTFDDGPNNGTDQLINVINETKIPATAFVVAKHVNSSSFQKKMYEKLESDTLFEIANHSYSHAKNKYSEFYKNPQDVVLDFKNAQDSLKLKSNIVRTPGRNIWRMKNVKSTDIKSSNEAADLLYKNNYKIIGWDLEWRATKNMTLKDDHAVMLKRIDSLFLNNLEKTPRHLVILTHDQYLRDANSVKELKLLITSLQKSKKFQFKKISEYPEIEGIFD